MRRWLIIASAVCATQAGAETSVGVTYLSAQPPPPPVLSNLDPVPEDLGLAGARLGLEENATTGRFLGQTYTLDEVVVAPDGDPSKAAREALGATRILLVDAPAETVLKIADLPEAADALVFNVAAPDRALRDEACRGNVLHTALSWSQRSDALAQFLVARRWSDAVLIAGTHPDDIAFADALRGSLTKFPTRLRGEKTWAFDADMRRNASQEVPLFTQDFRDHDVMILSDEIGDWARYVAYNTWLPRPVAGSTGLVPTAWSGVIEAWGAAQLQSRFEESAGREMKARDYAAWAAMRSLGEAVTRSQSDDVATLRDYILSADFELGGFKGRPLSFRAWNGQLRQPVALVTESALVATAPLEGFLHQTNELDSLGLDAPESACTAFGE